jgi:hypothetical protein
MRCGSGADTGHGNVRKVEMADHTLPQTQPYEERP